MNKPIDIVITTWNREWMTYLCLQAIANNTRTPHRIILIDNGSVPGARNNFMHQADIYVKLDRNYGLEYAKNLGMTFVESELFVSMDNDILVYSYEDKDWLERLVDLMNKYSHYGAISCKPQQLVGTGMGMFNTPDEVIPFNHVPGYARIMRTELTKRLGAWHDKRPLRGHEEYWICERMNQYKWKTGWANYIECVHLWGKENEDPWGYPKDSKPESHGHNPISGIPHNDPKFIFEKTGIEI